VGYEHLLGLSSLQRAESLAVPEHPALLALVEVAKAAEEAAPAGRAEAAEHSVALAHLGHAVAGRSHRSNELVPERETPFDNYAAAVDVKVRATHARRLDAHHGVIVRDQLGLGPLLEPNLAGGLKRHGLHGR
jgi:hypothetical protein